MWETGQEWGSPKNRLSRINGLYDDLPYMNKVHKWIMENVTVLARGDKTISGKSSL
jgi:hypothetical protein